MKFSGYACGLTLLALLVNAPVGMTAETAPRPVDTPTPRKDAPRPQQKKPVTQKSFPVIAPRRPGDKLDLGLCDGS